MLKKQKITKRANICIDLKGKTPEEAIELIQSKWEDFIDKENLRFSLVDSTRDEHDEYMPAYYTFIYDELESDNDLKIRQEMVDFGKKKKKELYEQLKKEFEP